MTVDNKWEDPTGALKKLAEWLNLDLESLQLSEEPNELSKRVEAFDAGKLALPQDAKEKAARLAEIDEVLKAMWEKYGKALVLTLKVGGLLLLSVDEHYDRSKLDEFFTKIKKNRFLTIDLTIDKTELLSHWNLEIESDKPKSDKATPVLFQLKLFLFKEALARALSVHLTKLEQKRALMEGFTGEQKLIILVPDQYIELNGDYLAVLGGEAVARRIDYHPTEKPADALKRVNSVYDAAKATPKWADITLKHLTPLHLMVDVPRPDGKPGIEPPKDDGIASRLYAQLAACSILYLATHSRWKVGESDKPNAERTNYSWVATFSADKYFGVAEVGNTDEIANTLIDSRVDHPWQRSLALGSLVKWVYEGEFGVANRLEVLQAVFAGSLQDNRSGDNLSKIVNNAAELSERVHRRWQAFMEDKVGKFFLQIKELEEIVDATTKAYNEQTQNLTKALTDNMLAAVAVVLGSLIAGFFSTSFDAYPLALGIAIYVLYLYLFPMRVGLSSAWQRFKDSSDMFGKRIEDFNQRLSEQDVRFIVRDTVRISEERFTSWFITTRRLYEYVVIGLFIIALLAIPYQLLKAKPTFEVLGMCYGESGTSETVSLLIQGKNFDKDKEIVVKIGDSGFTNVDGQTLRLYGSSVLALSARQTDLTSVRQKDNGFALVTQGDSAPKRISLPDDPAPIPLPAFEQWDVAMVATVGAVQASGSNFGSISDISFNGAKLTIKISSDGHRLELSDSELVKEPMKGKALEINLKNGERMQEIILIRSR